MSTDHERINNLFIQKLTEQQPDHPFVRIAQECQAQEPMNIMFACNNPDNGMPGGVCYAIEVADLHCELEGDPLEYSAERHTIALDGITFVYQDRHHWVGNWCWDELLFAPDEAYRLLDYVRSKQWDCMSAFEPFFNAWNEGKPLYKER